MAKLIMCKGLPASGKSTWAKTQDAVVVSKDEIRKYTKGEESVRKERDALVSLGIQLGLDVIVDDTNLNPIHEVRLREIASKYGAEFEIKEFDIDVNEAIKRDIERGTKVGAGGIRMMYNKYIKKG